MKTKDHLKKILILGAGIYQVPLIKKSKELGYYTIVVSYKGKYPGFSFADKIYFEDTINYKAIIDIAKNEKIDGICTSGTDVALVTIGKVCEALGLQGITAESGELSTNKNKMKNAFIKNKVRTAKFNKIYSIENAVKYFKKFNGLAIFKAIDSSGSRGIVKVDQESKIEDAFRIVMGTTKMDFFIIEEFLEGDEFGAQSFVYDGKIQFILPHGDVIFKGDTGVPVGHYVPFGIDKKLYNDLITQVNNSVKALKLDTCAINADLMFSNGQIYVLEIGARAGATCLPEIVSIYYNIDYYKNIIESSLGKAPDFNYIEKNPCAGELLISNKSGNIEEIKNNNTKEDWIYDISFDYSVGDYIKRFNVGPDRVGQVIVKGDTLEHALQNMNTAKKQIKILVN